MSKQLLLSSLESNIAEMREAVSAELEKTIEDENHLFVQVRRAQSIDQEIASQQYIYAQRRVKELESLKKSPFFAKVVYVYEDEVRETYISKYEFANSRVASWIAPISELRYEDLGTATVKIFDQYNKIINTNIVELTQKDSYVIGEDKVIYYSQETVGAGVEIIYEDFLNSIKSEYGLSEIVSKIEKEQFKIIQSDAKTPLIISGPAGSGKTTICLHRVAYLLQTPETADMYAGEKMLMLVQDRSTKDYFASILPKLGIADMLVLTYFEWSAILLELDINMISEINMYNISEEYLDLLNEKVKIIEKNKVKFKKFGTIFSDKLHKLYKKNLSAKSFDLYSQNENQYDYLDMTIMLSMMVEDNELLREDEYYKSLGDDKYKLYRRKTAIDYGMIIVDEFQNYTQDQIGIIRKCVNKRTKSVVYIGDMNQKSMMKPGSQSDVDHFMLCKKVALDKVYRNTKNILVYIKSKGYNVEIPEKSRAGEDVRVINVTDLSHLKKEIDIILEGVSTEIVGILFDSQDMLSKVGLDIRERTNIRAMTKIESQGTEFHTVISINEKLDESSKSSEAFADMKRAAKKNSDYVGYTRAVERLVVIEMASI